MIAAVELRKKAERAMTAATSSSLSRTRWQHGLSATAGFHTEIANSAMKRIYLSKKSDSRKPSGIKVFQPGTASSSMKRIYPSKKSSI